MARGHQVGANGRSGPVDSTLAVVPDGLATSEVFANEIGRELDLGTRGHVGHGHMMLGESLDAEVLEVARECEEGPDTHCRNEMLHHFGWAAERRWMLAPDQETVEKRIVVEAADHCVAFRPLASFAHRNPMKLRRDEGSQGFRAEQRADWPELFHDPPRAVRYFAPNRGLGAALPSYA